MTTCGTAHGSVKHRPGEHLLKQDSGRRGGPANHGGEGKELSLVYS